MPESLIASKRAFELIRAGKSQNDLSPGGTADKRLSIPATRRFAPAVYKRPWRSTRIFPEADFWALAYSGAVMQP
jgi:hypothetical protein